MLNRFKDMLGVPSSFLSSPPPPPLPPPSLPRFLSQFFFLRSEELGIAKVCYIIKTVGLL